MAESKRKLDKTAYCVASLTVSAARYYWNYEREKER
jgi:hypothetical protein